jgi:precorrin-6B methylase 2
MKSIISDPSHDPLGAMMLDYFRGNINACVEIESTDLVMTPMRGKTMFRQYSEMGDLEQYALELCRGKILDVGAGSGCHSLYLQNTGKDVEALDISPGCIETMSRRRIEKLMHQNVYSLEKRKYTTLLMLMNGLGICGTLDGLNLFFQVAKNIVVAGGQIIADSTDLRSLNEGTEKASQVGGCFIETEFIMRYHNIMSEPFKWLYVDFMTLQTLAEVNGFQCERLKTDQDGRYLVKIF